MNDFIQIWIIDHGGRSLIILLGARLLIYIIRHIFNTRLVKFIADAREKEKIKEKQLEARLKTIRGVIINFFKTVIYITAVMMILAEFQVNIGPILAGAGIVGLAVGFGSKKLVEDYIAGLFILVENQFAKGDKVQFLGATSNQNIQGRVYGFNLRRTMIIGEQGEITYLPNGQITRVINFSKKIKEKKIDANKQGKN